VDKLLKILLYPCGTFYAVIMLYVMGVFLVGKLGLSTTAAPVQAIPIQVDAVATYQGSVANVRRVIPLGTQVTASVEIDIGPGTPNTVQTPMVASGIFTWVNVVPQVFTVTEARIPGLSANGLMTFEFAGSGPTIAGLTAQTFFIRFDIGVNPFLTAQEMSDLIRASTIVDLRVGVGGATFTDFDSIGPSQNHPPCSYLALA